MNTIEKLRCPFVYATGKRCEGHVWRAKAYGPNADDGGIFVRKVRVWCSEKGDHAGSVSSWLSKDRMEFYPNQLPDDLSHPILALFERGECDVVIR